METKLTIGIPTYNGGKTLSRVFDSISDAATILDTNIEVVLSDNASEDDTECICNNYIFPRNVSFKYVKNNTNLGYDRNFNNVVENATSDYVWTLSDNEYISDKYGIKKVLSLLNKYSPDYLFLDYNNEIIIKHDIEHFNNSTVFFNYIKFKSGLISNNVLNRKKYLDYNIKKYIGTQWIHFGYQVDVLAPSKNISPSICILHDCIFTSLPTKRRWGEGGKFIEFGFKLCNIFKDMIALGYSNDTYRKALMVIKGGYPINIVSARNEGYIFNSSTIKLMDELFNSFISYRVFDKFFILLPLPLANIFILPLRIFNKLVFTKQIIFRKLLINGKFLI